MSEFKLRDMEEKDIETIYKHLHSKFVKKYFQNENLQKEFHNKKYLENLSSKNYIFHIFEDNLDNFVALVSYKIKENIAEVAIYLNKEYREKNYSKEILKKSIQKFQLEKNFITQLNAFILNENVSSKKLFLASGFRFIEKMDYNKHIGIEYLNFIKNLK